MKVSGHKGSESETRTHTDSSDIDRGNEMLESLSNGGNFNISTGQVQMD